MTNKKRLFAMLVFIPFLLLGCSKNGNPSGSINPSDSSDSGNPEPKEYFINPISPLDEETVSLANDDVTEFVKNYSFTSSSDYVKDYNHYDSQTSLSLNWTIQEEANYYVVEFSDDKELATPRYYLTNVASLEIDNVFPGKTYYWRVNAYFDTKIVRSYIFTVHTLSMPTTIYLESVGNFRDLGGLVTEDNKRIKNGLVFRGANADSVSLKDKNYLINDLGIKTELDLRNKDEGSRNVLGVANCVSIDDNGGFYYNNYPNGISYEAGQQVLVRELRYFANKDNYPIYFHCAIGRDRTGSLGLVLLALLGVSKKNICIDYELSMFALASTMDVRSGATNVQELLNALFTIYNYIYGGYSGSTMKEKTENFLLEIGLTQGEIDSIRNILLEDQ